MATELEGQQSLVFMGRVQQPTDGRLLPHSVRSAAPLPGGARGGCEAALGLPSAPG